MKIETNNPSLKSNQSKIFIHMTLFIFKNFYERHLGNVLIISLWVYLIGSILQKFDKYFYYDNFVHPITAFIKLVFFFFFIAVLALNFKIGKTLFQYLFGLSIVFVFANVKWNLDVNLEYDFFKSLKASNFFYLIKYLYPFIFLGVFSLTKNKEEIISRYFGILEKVLIVNAFFVFFGFFLSIDYFQSYPHSNRFGYDGLLDRLFFIYFSMIVILRRVFLSKIDSRFLIICLASLLSGTKLILLFFALLAVFYLYEKRKIRVLYIVSIILGLGIVFLKPIVNYAAKIFPFWQHLLTKYGYLTVLLSERDLLIQNVLEYFRNECTLNNFFFGGMEFTKYATQMDFIDLFLFFGVTGSAIYITLLSKIVNKYYHFIPLIASCFAGGFLYGTIIMCTYFLWMYENNLQQKGLF